ncbi:ROK family protein [Proteiniphilum sp. UBA5280]|uniref:ROK family protein n=1 Tax=Proteiniphilum sp. UBA5280 TaxID=1947273 RepID=UPI00257A6CE1|nr:ROK family protein [Proteiniphilum sp. UBA5280]
MAVIGIDLGGTKITGALFDENGRILCQVLCLLEERKESEVGRLVLHTIDELIERPEGRRDAVEALGICVPGIADSKTGLIWAPNINGWENYPLQKEIEEHFNDDKVTINIASDRTCYILGEKWKGAAKNATNAIYISIGTGIGVGILVDGNILHGHGDIVGSAGWFAIETPYREEFERYGCFESYASGDGIVRQVKRLLEDGTLFRESELYKRKIGSLSTKDIFEAVNNEDPLALFVIEKAIEMWGMASANLVSLLNPEIIIWGGGVFGPAIKYIERIYEEAARWAQPIAMKQVRFEKSILQGDAGLYGAGYLALASINNSLKMG